MDEQNGITPTPARATNPTPVPSPFDAPTLQHVENLSPVQNEPVPVVVPVSAVEPVVTPSPVPVVEPQPVIPAPVQSPTISAPAPAPNIFVSRPVEKQPSLLWLWITLAAIFIIGFTLSAVFFISKETVDKQADAYTTVIAGFVDKVHTDVNAAGTASEAKKALDTDAESQPVLKNGFLSSFSEKYTKAKSLKVTVDGKLKEFSDRIDELAGVDVYINHHKDNEVKKSTAAAAAQTATAKTDVTKAMGDVLTILKDDQSSIEKVVLPTELALAKVQLTTTFSDEVKYWTAMIDALKLNDAAAYSAALAQFTAAAGGESEPLDTINSYYYTLSVVRNDLLEKLDSFHKDLL